MDWELLVIGAGPAGLMAAKTAAEAGLKVLLVDLKREVERYLRLCASVLYTKPGFHGDSELLETDRIVFVENDFAVPYAGGYQPIQEWFYLSPGGKRFRMGKSNVPAAVAIDKSALLRSLLDQVLAAGVVLWTETTAMRVDNTADGVTVLIRKRDGTPNPVRARRCIISDGISSMVTQVSFPDLWKQRTHLASACGVGYLAENVRSPWGENHWALCKNRFGSAYFLPTPMRSARGNIIWKVLGFSTDPDHRQARAREALQCLIEEQPTAGIFERMEILDREGCAWDFYTPIRQPAQGHTLLVGDVCAMQEVDIQGALTCGFRAARAVLNDLDGTAGYGEYSEWWNQAFEFNCSEDPMRHLAKGFGLFALGADVLDYWFSLTENEVQNAFIDHNRLGELLEQGFNRYRSKMTRERPDVVRTLDGYFGISAHEAYRGYRPDGSSAGEEERGRGNA